MQSNESIVYLNGYHLPYKEASVSISDAGLLRGYGLYETLRYVNGKCVRYIFHKRRLDKGINYLKLPETLSHIDFESAIQELVEKNGLKNARVRITITAGTNSPTILITANTLDLPDLSPISVILSSFRRDEKNPLCSVKTTNCLTSILAQIEAKERCFDDAILLNNSNNVAESTTSNVVIVKGDKIITPSIDQGCLEGTTVEAIIQSAARIGMKPEQRAIAPEELFDADEVILTSAIKLVRLVGSIEGRAISRGKTAKLLLELLYDANI